MTDKRVVIRVLGPVDVVACGRSQEPSLLERNLLAVLASRMGGTVPTERLTDVLWATDPPRSARNRIQALVSSLRRRLATDAGAEEVIVTAGSGYRLNSYDENVDAARFERLVAEARELRDAGRTEGAAATLRDALQLWRGPAYDATDMLRDDEVRAEAARLDECRLVAIEESADLELALHRHGRLVPELTSLVRMHPFRERLRAQLMLSLARSGRHGEAAAVYREGYAVFTTELGIEPSPALRDLHQTILAGDGPAANGASGRRPGARVWAVPADLADFTGRTAELARLLTAGGGGAVVNLCGPGGVGKTSLALRFAHLVGDDYADGCLQIDLRGTGEAPADPIHVMGTVLHGLGQGTVPDDPDARTAVYRSALAQRSLLLVLDDALDERQVRPLIPPASRCATLITSRTALTGVDGATIVEVDVLPTGDALALLTNVIGIARVADEPLAASRVVELCGRLPLAIRIIGVRLARAPELRLARIVTRLADLRLRLDELAVDDRTVRASIALSYTRLDPMAAALLRALSELPTNEFAPWVAEALLGARPPVAGDALARLVDVSLVGVERSGAGARYRLHDLVRAFGQDRAQADDPSERRLAATRRLYEGLARLAVEANAALRTNSFPAASTPSQWFRAGGAADPADDPDGWFEEEHGLLVGGVRDAVRREWRDVAWRTVAAMTVHVGNRGGIDEWCGLVDLVLAGPCEAEEPEARPTLLLGLGGMLRSRGHTLLALRHLRQARTGFLRLGDANRAGIAACQLGIALRQLGRRRAAAAALRWATARIDATATQHLAMAHIGVGNLLLDEGDAAGARPEFERALEVLGPDGNPSTVANGHVGLGLMATLQGRHADAVEAYGHALRMLVDISDVASAGRVQLLLAEAYADHGDLVDALRYGVRARETLLDVGDIVGEARARAVIGQVDLADGRALEAAGTLTDVCECLDRAGHRLPLARSLASLGRARLALNDREGARAAAQRALEIYAAHGRVEAGAVEAWLSSPELAEVGVPVR